MSVILPRNLVPGPLFSASLGRWKKDPGCSWSRDHPENLLGGGGGGRVSFLVDHDVTNVVGSNPLVVAKNYSLCRGSSHVVDKECYTISAVFKM